MSGARGSGADPAPGGPPAADAADADGVDFIDVRPEEHADDGAAAGEPDAGPEGDDGLLFADEAGGDAAPVRPRPPTRRPPPRPGGPPPAAGGGPPVRAGEPAAPNAGPGRPASGIQRRAPLGGEAGARPSLGESGEGPGPRSASARAKRPDPALKRTSSGRLTRPSAGLERSAEEQAAALAALEARVQPAPAQDPYVGRDLGPFRVERFLELDRGERRYIASHVETKEPAYLRVFPLVGGHADELKRLAERAERAVRVEHPGLDRTLGSGKTKEAFFVGVEPPLGPTLAELLAGGPLGEDEVLGLVEQVARALQPLHGRDLAHAHVSPAVLRRPRPGTWVLHDAGVVRPRPALGFLVAGGEVLGVPGFIAPETVDSGEPTRAADLYALGCVAWTALCGRPPFEGVDEVQVLLDQLNREVPALAPPEGRAVGKATATIVAKLTGYTLDVRYRDAQDVLADIKANAAGQPVAGFGAPLGREEGPPRPKLRGATAGFVVLALLNLLLLTVLFYTWLQAQAVEAVDPFIGWELPVPGAPPPSGR